MQAGYNTVLCISFQKSPLSIMTDGAESR